VAKTIHGSMVPQLTNSAWRHSGPHTLLIGQLDGAPPTAQVAAGRCECRDDPRTSA
jgi:hypothetical protein